MICFAVVNDDTTQNSSHALLALQKVKENFGVKPTRICIISDEAASHSNIVYEFKKNQLPLNGFLVQVDMEKGYLMESEVS